ncbi:hypothetical protein [Lentzea aerocolonigenes]|uniref:hypothetical protein n=1 Tax=Lentzea aerocolonigenes TaxID=68170 RepID=UPI0004C465C7|nr:hypothetical protein [Lentzea aerocolonigenes]MCP2245732.1 hypothetical protein [Lentzea aerocolonigenes]
MAGGELQRLSAQADMLPIMRTHGGLMPSRELRQLQTTLRQEIADGVVKDARIEIATHVTMKAMDSVADVDAHRRALAGDDSTLNALLAQVEMNHVQSVGRIQRGTLF